MTKENFLQLLRENSAKIFCRNHLLSDSCWLFDNLQKDFSDRIYEKIRQDISQSLDVNPREIAVVGSAKFGFSMSPTKNFRPFDFKYSDLDLVIVSSSLFEEIWASLRSAYYAGYNQVKPDHSYEIFSKFVVLRSADRYHTQYLRDVSLKLKELNKIINRYVNLSEKVKYRIYCDWSDVEAYHEAGVNIIKKGLINVY